ncbi:MAG TPA: DUF3226 domain-containing protein [Methylobacter sp.]|jgi:hypothetical protein
MSEKFKSDATKILLAEGDNDCHVIAALCKNHAVPQNFGLNACGSDDLVFKTLGALLNTENKRAIGVVLDADNPNFVAKWHKFQAMLNKANIHCGGKPDPIGTIIPANDDHPRIGLWLMPDNSVDGMLEDFCLTMAESTAIDFAQDCVSTAQEKGHASFIANHHSKAVVHTYLAWQDEPGRPLGQAITAKVLDPKHPLAEAFADWLKRLFADT